MIMKKFLLLMSMIICFSSFSAFALQDTLWTRETMPYNIKSAIFSPDGQYIYASSDGIPSRLFQYDLNGNLISTNDTVGGIKQFSQDGKYFWNLVGDKYEFANKKKVGNSISAEYDFNEPADIGIANNGITSIVNNIIFFRPSDMQVIDSLTHPGTDIVNFSIWNIMKIAISSDGKQAALHVAHKTFDGQPHRKETIEIWDIATRSIIDTMYENQTQNSEILKMEFSPDGKYLGISNERKLLLYSTSDWSLIHTFDYTQTVCGVKSFAFSKDNKTLYVGSDGILKIKLDTKTVDFTYKFTTNSTFINESPDRKNLISETGKGAWLVLMDNSIASIPEEKAKTTVSISPNPSIGILNITITPETEQALIYSISDLEGNIMLPSMKKELTAGVNQIVINIGELPSGAYFLNATLDGQTKSYKFVVER